LDVAASGGGAPWLMQPSAVDRKNARLERRGSRSKGLDVHASSVMQPGRGRRRRALVVAVVLLLTAFAFQSTLHNELVDWDDEPNLVVNTAYRGLAWENIHWMFTTAHGGHYQPLSWMSFAVDYKIWGVNAFGFHLTNLLLHLVAVAGFYFVALEMIRMARVGEAVGPDGAFSGSVKISSEVVNGTAGASRSEWGGDSDVKGSFTTEEQAEGSPLPHGRGTVLHEHLSLGAGVAALLFAVHPLRVESVAWATERRDVLSGALLMPAVYLYLRAVPSRKYTAYLAASLLLYVLSLLAKASAMTLPLVLLLIDYYPLRRLGRDRSETPEGRAGLRGILFEKAFYAVPAVLIAGLAWAAQRTSGAMWSLAEHPLSLRLAQACYGVFFYLGKTVWPVGLSPLYQQPPDDFALRPVYLACGVGVVMVTGIIWRLRHRWPAIAVAWGAYLVLLLPVLGFAQSGPQLVADRYTYLACLPWAVLVGGWVLHCWMSGGAGSYTDVVPERSGSPAPRIIISTAVIVLVIVLVVLTRSQTRVWADSHTLWSTVIERRPDTGLAHANLAGILNRRGEFEAARDHAGTALKILPGNRTAHLQLAFAASALGDLETAERHYRTGLEIARHLGEVDTSTMTSLAFVLARMERWVEAEALLRAVIETAPGVGQWHFNLGMLLVERERYDEAATALVEALRVEPGMVEAYVRLSFAFEKLDQPGRAIEALERGLAMAPDDVNLLAELAMVLSSSGEASYRDPDRAMSLAFRAVDYSNGLSVRAREALAHSQAAQHDFTSASETIRRLLADERLDISEETRTRLLGELEKFENRHVP
jgi:protein O-mannosyl-transferase